MVAMRNCLGLFIISGWQFTNTLATTRGYRSMGWWCSEFDHGIECVRGTYRLFLLPMSLRTIPIPWNQPPLGSVNKVTSRTLPYLAITALRLPFKVLNDDAYKGRSRRKTLMTSESGHKGREPTTRWDPTIKPWEHARSHCSSEFRKISTMVWPVYFWYQGRSLGERLT